MMASSQGTQLIQQMSIAWYIPFQMPLLTQQFTLFFFFSDNIMANVASKQQTTALFLSTTITHTRRHTELTKKLPNLMGNLCCARQHSVQLFTQFIFTQLNCTVYLRVYGDLMTILNTFTPPHFETIAYPDVCIGCIPGTCWGCCAAPGGWWGLISWPGGIITWDTGTPGGPPLPCMTTADPGTPAQHEKGRTLWYEPHGCTRGYRHFEWTDRLFFLGSAGQECGPIIHKGRMLILGNNASSTTIPQSRRQRELKQKLTVKAVKTR